MEQHFWQALRYVERNPVRAGMVRTPWRYQWSSAAGHIGENDVLGLIDYSRWRKLAEGVNWQETLLEPQDDQEMKFLRTNTHTGRPLGSDKFISKLERTLGKRLRPLPIGRPRTRKKKNR